jgi:hypothetical protein
MVTETFAGVDVAQVDFDGRNSHPGDGIAERHTGMGETTGIDQEPIALTHRRLHCVDQGSFMVGLKTAKLDAQIFGIELKHSVNFWKRFRTVDPRLALAKQVQVWAVENEDAQNKDLTAGVANPNWNPLQLGSALRKPQGFSQAF